MRIDELLNEEGFLSTAWNTLMHGTGDDMELYIKAADKLLPRYGTQGTLKQLKKKFPKAAPIDLNRAVKQALSKRG